MIRMGTASASMRTYESMIIQSAPPSILDSRLPNSAITMTSVNSTDAALTLAFIGKRQKTAV